MTRVIPGMIDVDGREFFYLETWPDESFHNLIDDVLDACLDVPMPTSGGVVEEKAYVLLGDGQRFSAISYKGDLARWREKLICYCSRKKRKWGIVSNQKLVLSDGSTIPLSECKAVFDY